MEIYRSLEQAAAKGDRAVVTIGSFDGIHLAHQQLLGRARECAGELNAASVAVTLDPHPLQILAPQKAPRLLTPLAVKLELFEKSGVDRLLVLPFTEEFSRWTPERFVEEALVKALRVGVAVVGDNFRFGHRHAGTPELLQELGRKWNFRTEIVPRIYFRKTVVSSSTIRRLLEQGKISLANRLLGRCFSVRNRIKPGLGIGRNQTVPTLNLARYEGVLPAVGVYITWAHLGARRVRSVTNVGYRPTFGERELGVETHLLDPWDDPVPETLEVSFLYRLRDERKFETAEELKAQILKDIRRAERYFRRLERFRVAAVREDAHFRQPPAKGQWNKNP